jgi:glycogen operon protein
MGRTQGGNNNAYCQDNPLTWISWETEPYQQEFLEFVQQVSSLRRDLGLGDAHKGSWLSADASKLTPVEQARRRNLPFGWLRTHADCQTLTIFNADDRGHLFELPHSPSRGSWRLLINTARPGKRTLRGHAVRVPARSVLLLKLEP